MVQLLESKHHQAIYYLVDHLDYLCNDHLFAGHISIIPNERQTGKAISFTRNQYNMMFKSQTNSGD